jgi:hypothetical protein
MPIKCCFQKFKRGLKLFSTQKERVHVFVIGCVYKTRGSTEDLYYYFEYVKTDEFNLAQEETDNQHSKYRNVQYSSEASF